MNKQRKKTKTPINKKVESLNLVDYSQMKAPLVVVYDSPLDFPDKIIARVWEGATNSPTNVYCEYETLDQCEKDIQTAEFTLKFPRCPVDDIHIVEVCMR